MAMAKKNAEWILVLDAEEGKTVWHQRRVCGRLACRATEEPRYIIQTPDGDMYAEQYVANDDITAFRWCFPMVHCALASTSKALIDGNATALPTISGLGRRQTGDSELKPWP
eukprot:2204715-Amphidinium_carterae.1